MTNDCISIEKDEDMKRDEKELKELFNENFVNIVETSSGNEPSSLGNCEDNAQDDVIFNKIISKHSAHSSVQNVKKIFSVDEEFELAYVNSTQPAITCSKLTTETTKQAVKYVQS